MLCLIPLHIVVLTVFLCLLKFAYWLQQTLAEVETLLAHDADVRIVPHIFPGPPQHGPYHLKIDSVASCKLVIMKMIDLHETLLVSAPTC